MEDEAVPPHDALLMFRGCVMAARSITPTASREPDPNAKPVPLSLATHLQFSIDAGYVCLPLDAPTRYITTSGAPLDLRSVHFAYTNHQQTIPQYHALVDRLNEEFTTAGVSRRLQGVSFVERLELVAWLEGADECDRIKPLEGEAAAAAKASDAANKQSLNSRQKYKGERTLLDHNTVLQGVNPQDFSFARQFAQEILKDTGGGGAEYLSFDQRASRRPDPIILLSPAVSALVRMSNAKIYFEQGKFIPPDAPAFSHSPPNLLHISRLMKEIDPRRPTRFTVVDNVDQFKPDYWNRVVAVVTTGQLWQFKSYKWTDPHELFRHVVGIYVGYKAEVVPELVKAWLPRVIPVAVSRWRDVEKEALVNEAAIQNVKSNYRDEELVEHIWKSIENNMVSKGWRKDNYPSFK